MKNNAGLLWTSVALGVLNVFTAVGLLLFSAWFIVACAIAGAPGAVAGFNYVVPAAIIRFLAILRISSGYVEKYTGHLHLLNQLQFIRSLTLGNVFQHIRQLRSDEAAQALQQETEQWAARWNASYSPMVSTLVLWCIFTVAFYFLWFRALTFWLAFSFVILAGWLSFSVFFQRIARQEFNALTRFQFVQRQWLHRATLWPLVDNDTEQSLVNTSALSAAKARHQRQQLSQSVELSILPIALLFTGVLALSMSTTNTIEPLWIVPFFVLMSAQDWLTPAFQAIQHTLQLHQFTHLKPSHLKRSAVAEVHAQQCIPRNLDVRSIVFDRFQWQRASQFGPRFTATLQGQGLYWISAPSGVGKSSFFYALTGQLPFKGSACVNGIDIRSLDVATRQLTFHYMEQFGHIFSDTLAANLRMSNPLASDQRLIDALRWAELPQWATAHGLSLWLGAEGLPVSGGEEKRLLLARAYLSEASVLLLDEPFESLDTTLIEALGPKIQTLSQQKCILLASHIQPTSMNDVQMVAFS